jgi:tRNA pseudouridine38-40 synthase
MAVNSLVGPALCVRHAEETDPDFHARFRAVRRTYDYFVSRAAPGPVLTRWVVGDPYLRPDAAERMRSALAGLTGEHDFAAFCGAGGEPGSTVRNVYAAGVEERGGLIRFRITASAFLKSMVRIIAGLLLEIGEGRREPAALMAALRAGRREAAGVTAPPHGLFLVRVDYPDGFPGEKVRDTAPFWPAV